MKLSAKRIRMWYCHVKQPLIRLAIVIPTTVIQWNGSRAVGLLGKYIHWMVVLFLEITTSLLKMRVGIIPIKSEETRFSINEITVCVHTKWNSCVHFVHSLLTTIYLTSSNCHAICLDTHRKQKQCYLKSCLQIQ